MFGRREHLQLNCFIFSGTELSLKLIRQVNELKWLYFIIEITQPTVAIKKYQRLPCSLLLPSWGLGSGGAVGPVLLLGPGLLACGRCLHTVRLEHGSFVHACTGCTALGADLVLLISTFPSELPCIEATQ